MSKSQVFRMLGLLVIAVTLGATMLMNSYAQATHAQLRNQLRQMLGIPMTRCDLAPETRGQIEHDGIVIEKWIFTAEPGSRVPALLYRPAHSVGPMPAIVFTYGHGNSKSSWCYDYAAQIYAKLGVATLAMDPIGEEERNLTGQLASRAHDARGVSERCDAAGRLIMGKFVFDTMRGVDFLLTRHDIAHDRIGVAGYSLGGATAGWTAVMDTRLRMAIVAGWAYDDIVISSKLCQRLPFERMRKLCSWTEYAALTAPQCAVLFANGDADTIIDSKGDGACWRSTQTVVTETEKVYAALGVPHDIATWFQPGGGHRPYFVDKNALAWINQHLGTPGHSLEGIRALPTCNAGAWCDAQAIPLENLYATPLHWRGATLPELMIHPLPPKALACLHPDEIGKPEFTLEGWLMTIERK